jgi:hypothetical protein
VLAAAAHAPAVPGTQPGRQVQPEIAVSQVRAGDWGGWAVGGGVGDNDQRSLGRTGHADPDRGTAVPQPVGGQLLESEQQPLQFAELHRRRHRGAQQGDAQPTAGAGQIDRAS